MHTDINVTSGCSASTERGTPYNWAPITTAAQATPAPRQAHVRRLTSPKPEKRHMLCGTRSVANSARYTAMTPSITQVSYQGRASNQRSKPMRNR